MGGKGVILPGDLDEAQQALRTLMVPGSPGEAVVIEDRRVGVERSVTAIVDGATVRMLPHTQDYKRVGDGDTGPNTGGMGAHTLELPASDEARLSQILSDVVAALAEEGCPYTGFMYLGFIEGPDGFEILECNCRPGDPEALVLLPSITGDFAALSVAAAEGRLADAPAPIRHRHALCVVLASGAYPDPSDRDDPITGLDEAPDDNALVFHGGTARRDGAVTTNRVGRVIYVVGLGSTLRSAHAAAYARVKQLWFPGMQYRRDIGAAVIG
jgi:phosphoribosylamine--glycine ligase